MLVLLRRGDLIRPKNIYLYYLPCRELNKPQNYKNINPYFIAIRSVIINAMMFAEPITSFSFLLVDDKLTIDPKTKNATTNHIPILPML